MLKKKKKIYQIYGYFQICKSSYITRVTLENEPSRMFLSNSWTVLKVLVII